MKSKKLMALLAIWLLLRSSYTAYIGLKILFDYWLKKEVYELFGEQNGQKSMLTY